MPKKTFFRLPVEKQQRLLKAAHAEFSRVPFNEASVSNIIKAAEIPRGSFYQYFEDKADIFFYDLSLLRDSSKQDLEQLLLDTKGDLFKTIRIFFKAMANEAINGENAQFYRHLFLHMDFKNRRKMSPELMHAHQTEGFQFLMDHVDFSLLKIDKTQPNAVRLLLHQLMNNVFQSIASYYLNRDTEQALTIEQIYEHFELVTGWLETGASVQDK
ncbi:TetR family transcriptional regulator [Latilactobacillus sakei]|uniref:TetR family transcriptional regulator n=1 Tax=Latilactobacillus sakei TaxID=1599 RepID=UPI0005074DA0|nr:TetR family transcriptional regulator [Latilactobacillus sakei]AST83727.1 TetR/AcrR family transcriptional regulator [Latilactobacillus sakei]AWZ41672.1 TetR/AcrR family transcriptional regulator [Latilactobacillus sakei]AWZ47153.1 TetR/AcrR family transcriptional regulator [Latilactobacillus sakei]AYG16868.1 TetR/AcrR family transcriptional regulator [Latilactobacillus sakei]AYG25590.1 TetR/AcrR family transcriptional regulator [Latilactobacillus sakei]